MSDLSSIKNLLAGIQFEDPRLYSLLSQLTDDFFSLYFQVNPPITPADFAFVGQLVLPSDVSGFISTIYGNNLRLNWNAATGATFYRIKYLSGSGDDGDWSSASSILNTYNLSADLNPITIPLTYGDHTFLIKAINSASVESDTAAVIVINIPEILAPTISPTVLSNYVLLKWTTPASTFDIAYYLVLKNGSTIGRVTGTFEVIFELAAGTFEYTVEAVDIVGNVGTPSAAALVTLIAPPDFTRQGTVTSTLSGTKVKCALDTPASTRLLACVNITETWAEHFTNRSWSTIDDQINAGYPIYQQPSETTATYTEVFDFGSLFSNASASITWNEAPISGTIVITTTMETSVDNATWSSPVAGNSIFAASVRYVRVVISFAGTDTELTQFYNLICSLDVQKVLDSGTITANSGDSGGTLVTYNKVYSAAPDVNVTAIAVQPLKTVVTSITTTTFRVLVFDSTGARITFVVDWKARGIVT